MQQAIKEYEQEAQNTNKRAKQNLIIANIDVHRLMHDNTPSCGVFYNDIGIYLNSKKLKPRKPFQNEAVIVSHQGAAEFVAKQN